ncbi:MAG: hypothetical protein GF365_01895 [Candidatus Buchananbacteria bacterium]|nr:hypothetical protein [Candidatus Buchananbacteria bacterium]
MGKTFLIIVIFVIFVVFISIAFSLFISPGENDKISYEECVLLQNPETGEVDCFGCANGVCKDAPADWVLYEAPEIGIPYSCFASEQGCQLAQ